MRRVDPLRLCLAALLAACTAEAPASHSAPPVVAPVHEPEGSAVELEEPAAPTVLRLRVEPDALLLGQGMDAQLTARALGEDGHPVDVPIEWRSLSPSRLSVSADGAVSSVGALGPGFVVATYGEFLVEVPVRVVPESELPQPEEDTTADEGSGADEAVVVVRGAEAPAEVELAAVTRDLHGTWSTRQVDGRERIVTFHPDGRLLDERRGERWIGRWRAQIHEVTQIRIHLRYDDTRHGAETVICAPPAGGVLQCGERAFTRRSR